MQATPVVDHRGWWSRFWSGVAQLFKSPDGTWSATRLVFLTYACAILVVWIVVSASDAKLVDIPNSVAAVLAALATGKAVQSIGEKKS